MKVLMINSVCGIRSTGRICTDLAANLESQGHEVKIAYGRESVPEKYQKYGVRIGNECNVLINALKCRLFDNDGFSAKKQTKKILNWAEEYNPDELWIHNLHGYYINVELLFEWIKSRPQMKVKWTFHDCWPITGHCSHFDYVQCSRWITGCYKCPLKRQYPKSIFYDNSRKNYRLKKMLFDGINNLEIITPSTWLADLVKKSYFKNYPVTVVNNKIDLSIFKPTRSNFREKYGLENKIIILGVASVWSKKKGLDDFIRLSNILDENYKIVMVGLTKKQIKKTPKSILAIEKTNSAKELAQIYTAADIFLNLTYEDNYPTVNLESQACGTPVITYRTGGSIESVPKENTVEQGNIDELLLKIVSIRRAL